MDLVTSINVEQLTTGAALPVAGMGPDEVLAEIDAVMPATAKGSTTEPVDITVDEVVAKLKDGPASPPSEQVIDESEEVLEESQVMPPPSPLCT